MMSNSEVMLKLRMINEPAKFRKENLKKGEQVLYETGVYTVPSDGLYIYSKANITPLKCDAVFYGEYKKRTYPVCNSCGSQDIGETYERNS